MHEWWSDQFFELDGDEQFNSEADSDSVAVPSQEDQQAILPYTAFKEYLLKFKAFMVSLSIFLGT